KQMVCDVSVLETLPKEQMRNGLVEVIKHGLILDENYFRFVEENLQGILEKEESLLEKTVSESVRIKSKIVAADEREKGERMKLNYGHTVGHGIEAVSGILHGEAISIGMAAEVELSQRLGFLSGKELERQNGLLQSTGLPLRMNADPELVMDRMKNDKKRVQGVYRIVLLDKIGSCHVENVAESDVRLALKSVLE
ncbi:MAG TPA: 3-dehydroquinate synthase family protein, partial [Candidatus Norongarragalinales archaeon]|nr:3-dehydroquinate synthase family protein [Candidatus Norongarragalinales archaeon]